MESLPASVTPYRRTPEFTETTIPAAMRRSHSTKAGVWGRIRVLEGLLIYRILEPALEEIELHPGCEGVIAPESQHEVEPRGPVRFFVEFLR